MDAIEKFEVAGLIVKLFYDEDAESPREWDNLGILVCFHRRYNLGDETDFGYHDPSDFEAWRKEHADEIALILPVYLYDHSGLRIKIGSFHGLLPQGHAEFDSGQVGYIYVTKERLREEYSVKRITKATITKAERVLNGEIDTYDQFLSGQVYGYVVETKPEDEDEDEGEHLDSCWGIFGFDYAREEATRAAKYEAESIAKKQVAQLDREATSAGDVPDPKAETRE